MKFRDYITEAKEKHAVLAFGRMNPPTTGHAKLVDKVKEVAKDVGGSHHIVLSHSQDAAKNPLTAEQKIKHAKRYFHDTNISTSDKEHPNFLSQASKLHKQGATHLHMIAGSDRIDEYHKILHKYNGVKGTHGYFKFKDIQVHSAGERDPDAEGVEGMSASKMREHASKGNFKEFKKGVPGHVAKEHAKDLYNDVRKGMGIKESLEEVEMDILFEEILLEGVHDKGIFKAIFLGGGPGSGKDYVLDNTLAGHGLTELNSDRALEFLMDKHNLDKKMPADEESQRNEVRKKAKSITELRQMLAIQGRNGLIINGTADDPAKVLKIKELLEKLGYETSMLMVNTRDEVSQQRNVERGQRGGRTVPENIRKEKWDSVQAARPELSKLFGGSYMEFDNSEDLRMAPPDMTQAKKQEMLQLFKNVQKFVSSPPKNDIAKQWIGGELNKKDTLPIPKNQEVAPHPDSKAADEAKRLGLTYFGFGRYGRNGKVTHRSVHDKLVDVTSIVPPKEEKIPSSTSQSDSAPAEKKLPGYEMKKLGDKTIHVKYNKNKNINEDFEIEEELGLNEDLRNWFKPDHPEGGWKRINSKGEAIGPCAREPGEPKPKCMSNEKRASLTKKERANAVRLKRKHDPNPERKGEPINVSNYGKGKISEQTVEEAKDFSKYVIKPTKTEPKIIRKTNPAGRTTDHVEYEVHGTLSSHKRFFKSKKEAEEYFNTVKEETKPKEHYLKDSTGKIRIFMLRRAAAKEAHQRNGEIEKHNNGYAVKLKEEYIHVIQNSSTIQEATNRGSTSTPSTGWTNKESDSYARTRGEERRIAFSEAGTISRDTINSGTSNIIGATSRVGSETNRSNYGRITEEKAEKKKLTISEIKSKQKEKVKESIDKGIEPGLSMASSGESIARDTGEKIKKYTGKSTQVRETIGDGGEMINSMAAKKEDDLKKVGINLKSFKSKNYL